ncbi:MAG: hypothetical protein ACLUIS_00835 [Longibaculum sp.]
MGKQLSAVLLYMQIIGRLSRCVNGSDRNFSFSALSDFIIFFKDTDVKIALLTGSLTNKERAYL